MSRRDAALQGTLVFGLILGIVGGNFALHRWIMGSASSREADAGVTNHDPLLDDLAEFAPNGSPAATIVDPAAHRARLKWLIDQMMPSASADEVENLMDELADVPLPVAEGVLDLRRELDKLKAQHDSALSP